MVTTWLSREFGIDIPVLGAPMGGRAGGALAGAVSAAGGLGLLGAAGTTRRSGSKRKPKSLGPPPENSASA